eukprot:4888269-Amphidinium_carterae.1
MSQTIGCFSDQIKCRLIVEALCKFYHPELKPYTARYALWAREEVAGERNPCGHNEEAVASTEVGV